jgi:hypothetical protein
MLRAPPAFRKPRRDVFRPGAEGSADAGCAWHWDGFTCTESAEGLSLGVTIGSNKGWKFHADQVTATNILIKLPRHGRRDATRNANFERAMASEQKPEAQLDIY